MRTQPIHSKLWQAICDSKKSQKNLWRTSVAMRASYIRMMFTAEQLKEMPQNLKTVREFVRLAELATDEQVFVDEMNKANEICKYIIATNTRAFSKQFPIRASQFMIKTAEHIKSKLDLFPDEMQNKEAWLDFRAELAIIEAKNIHMESLLKQTPANYREMAETYNFVIDLAKKIQAKINEMAYPPDTCQCGGPDCDTIQPE